uniref:Uncharacterized protein n=1 Tax=Molossus molossus TaxID=27622 RepID=A0A7J8C8I2_MOLMO|nr:hypothetical protein HJG59_009847 [Molossus molossus]
MNTYLSTMESTNKMNRERYGYVGQKDDLCRVNWRRTGQDFFVQFNLLIISRLFHVLLTDTDDQGHVASEPRVGAPAGLSRGGE